MVYGIGYKGSKNKIADDIIGELPAGKRFVDLFGGGFAMSHCALLSGKYEGVYYSDIDPLLPQLIEKAINGGFSYERFTPEFISRAEFFKKKDSDGYVKYIWSFGNIGKGYIYGKSIESKKRELHNMIVQGDREKISERRLALRRNGKVQLEHLERLERLQHLEQLERMQCLEGLKYTELHSHDYREYEYRDGDVIYCDIPYKGTNNYGMVFDEAAFIDWAAAMPCDVYVSSYDITDSRAEKVWETVSKTTLSPISNSTKVVERLYVI